MRTSQNPYDTATLISHTNISNLYSNDHRVETEILLSGMKDRGLCSRAKISKQKIILIIENYIVFIMLGMPCPVNKT